MGDDGKKTLKFFGKEYEWGLTNGGLKLALDYSKHFSISPPRPDDKKDPDELITYRGSFDNISGWSEWTKYSVICPENQCDFFIQAIMIL